MKPILFNTEMVKAVLEGRKTQTRRVIKLREFQASDTKGYDYIFRDKRALWNDYTEENFIKKKCPYGQVGDKLYVRETWCDPNMEGLNVMYKADFPFGYTNYNGDLETMTIDELKWKPSIHMPKEYSRITLEITDIRVERVQDISNNDIEKEGIELEFTESIEVSESIQQTSFQKLWDSINKKRGYGWDINPYAWCIEFKLIK